MKTVMGPSGTTFQYDEKLEGDVVVTPMGHVECRFPIGDLLELMMVWMAEAEALDDKGMREAFAAAARRAGQQ
jgi:hypothetical protein